MRILSVALGIIFVFFQIRPVFPYLDYQFNKDSIISELCENKNKPELNCEGKCHLNSEIKKQQKEEEQQNIPAKEQKLQIASLDFINPDTEPNYFTSSETELFFGYKETYSLTCLEDCFRPPQV